MSGDAWTIGVVALVLEYLAARSRDDNGDRLARHEAAITVLDSRVEELERWRGR